jgi:hypothetical protein
MFRPRPTFPRPRSLYSNQCHPERSEGSWLVRTLAPTAPFEQSLLCRRPLFLAVGCELSTVNCHPLTPFPATLTSQLQLAENKTTLSPAVATLTSRVKHNPFVCHSYKKHPGWGYAIVNFFVAQTSVCALLRQPISESSDAKDPQESKNLAVLPVTSQKSLSPVESAVTKKSGGGGHG